MAKTLTAGSLAGMLMLYSSALLLPIQVQGQIRGVPLDPRMPAGLSFGSYLSHAAEGAGGGLTLGVGPILRAGDFVFAAIGGARFRDERRYPIVGGAMSLNMLSFPRHRPQAAVKLALQLGLAYEVFDLDPESAVLVQDVPAQRAGTIGVMASFRVPVAGTVVHPWVSGGVRAVTFDVQALEGRLLPDLDGFGSARPAFGAGFSVGLGGTVTLEGMADRSWIMVPDPRVELGYGREYDSVTATLGLRFHMSDNHSK